MGMVKTWLNSGHILKVEPIGFADRWNADYEKSKDVSKICAPRSRKTEAPSAKVAGLRGEPGLERAGHRP